MSFAVLSKSAFQREVNLIFKRISDLDVRDFWFLKGISRDFQESFVGMTLLAMSPISLSVIKWSLKFVLFSDKRNAIIYEQEESISNLRRELDAVNRLLEDNNAMSNDRYNRELNHVTTKYESK